MEEDTSHLMSEVMQDEHTHKFYEYPQITYDNILKEGLFEKLNYINLVIEKNGIVESDKDSSFGYVAF